MISISVNDIYKNYVAINKKVLIFGWVRNRRHSNSGISFIDVYDGSSVHTIQCIINNTIVNYDSEVLKLTSGCAISVQGVLVYAFRSIQKYEIKVIKIKIIGWVDSPQNYPVSAKKHTYQFLREIPHLRPRTNYIGVVTRIRNHVFHALHTFLYEKNYYWIPTPIITSLDSEGAGSMFRVSTLDMKNIPTNVRGEIDFNKDFFGKESFLTVSGQLTAESYACSMGKIYTFGPTFRAEHSNTTRHLSEFWMLEIEVAFAKLNDIISLSKSMIKYVTQFILNTCTDDINFLYDNIDKNIFFRLENCLLYEIIDINYNDAIKILLNSNYNFNNPVQYGLDLCAEHEKYLVDKYFCAPIIVKNYPKKLKAFYMRVNDDKKHVAAMDMLVPGVGELIGGSQREDRISILKERLLECNLCIKDYNWYLDLRKYGSIPHAGFGLGLERLLSYITGIKNIKDLIPFPRNVNHLLC
ncbi:Asparagine--tRNA ligase [Buchnera aphidicola (Pterocallis alni)]|uniref:asparagine--tRNA ligase n=1 Tax=Buchnera aphidicola TaxID=9 RepID=UPI003463DE8C